MPSVRDLRDRIRSLKNTEQITKAMKQVAAAKIRRAEATQKRARPYADSLADAPADRAFVREQKADITFLDYDWSLNDAK